MLQDIFVIEYSPFWYRRSLCKLIPKKKKKITMQIYWKASAYNGTLKLPLKSDNIFLVSWLDQFNCETAYVF